MYKGRDYKKNLKVSVTRIESDNAAYRYILTVDGKALGEFDTNIPFFDNKPKQSLSRKAKSEIAGIKNRLDKLEYITKEIVKAKFNPDFNDVYLEFLRS